MQLAKVVIVSTLVLGVCAEGLTEGKDCVLKCTPGKIVQTAYLGCYTEVDCSMNFNVLTVCTSNEYHQKESEMNSSFSYHPLTSN